MNSKQKPFDHPQAPVRSQEPPVRQPGVFCCWIHATRCNFIGPEKTCKLGELGECAHKFHKPNPSHHAEPRLGGDSEDGVVGSLNQKGEA